MITKFNDKTPVKLQNLLHELNGSKERIRIFYGDTMTGRAWPEEFDVIGSIGNSTGSAKIPLLINNRRSYGGPGLLDHCIVAIYSINRGLIYSVNGFNVGQFELKNSDLAGYETDVLHDGVIHARFKAKVKAGNFIKFMTGERFRK
jgi:hypothetical protein